MYIEDHPNREEIQAAENRIFKFLPILIIVVLVILVTGSVVGVIKMQDPCGYVHRQGTVLEDGTVRYIQNRDQYIPLEILGLEENVSIGDKIELCFDINDKFIGACKYQDKEGYITTGMIIIGSSILLSLILVIAYYIFFRHTKYGKAYYDFLDEQRRKENEEIPLIVRIIITIVSILIALFIMRPEIHDLIKQIQSDRSHGEFGEFIQNTEEYAEENIGKLEQATDDIENMDVSESLDKASDSANNIKDILNSLENGDE